MFIYIYFEQDVWYLHDGANKGDTAKRYKEINNNNNNLIMRKYVVPAFENYQQDP